MLIFANSKPLSQSIKSELSEKLRACGFNICEDCKGVDYIVTIGGDGTLLSAFHKFGLINNSACFLGIHTGHLGFYADFQPEELDLVVSAMKYSVDHAQDQKHIRYPLIEASIKLTDGNAVKSLALNEFCLRSIEETMVCDIEIQGDFFETFRGDGVCVSTPTGSTGLNKSLGGAVIHPSLDALQLSEIASINNRVYRTLSSSIIIPKDEWFTLKPNRDKPLVYKIDNQPSQTAYIQQVQLKLSSYRIKFLKIKHTHFWDRVESSFIGRKFINIDRS